MNIAGCALGKEYMKKRHPEGQPFRGPWKTMEHNKVGEAIRGHEEWLRVRGGRQINFRRIRIQDYDFGEADLRQAIFTECAILRCDMLRANLADAEFPGTNPSYTKINYDNGAIMDMGWAHTHSQIGMVAGAPIRQANKRIKSPVNSGKISTAEWLDRYRQPIKDIEVKPMQTESKTEVIELEVMESEEAITERLPVQLAGMTLKELRVQAEGFGSLTVQGEGNERRKSFLAVERGHKDGKKLVTQIKNRTKEARKIHMDRAKRVSTAQNTLLGVIEPVVGHLANERTVEESRVRKIMERKVDAERHRIAIIRHEIDSRKAGWTDAVLQAESSEELSCVVTEIGSYEIDPFFFGEFTFEFHTITDAAAIAANSAFDLMVAKEQAESARKAEVDRIAAEQAAEAKRLEEERRVFAEQQAEAEAERRVTEKKAEDLARWEAELKTQQEAAEAEIARKQAIEAKRMEEFEEEQAKAEAARKAEEAKDEAHEPNRLHAEKKAKAAEIERQKAEETAWLKVEAEKAEHARQSDLEKFEAYLSCVEKTATDAPQLVDQGICEILGELHTGLENLICDARKAAGAAVNHQVP